MTNGFRRRHKCDVCREYFFWTSESCVYGSIGHEDCGARQFVVCSPECMRKAPRQNDLQYIVGKYKSRRQYGYVTDSHWEDWDSKTGRFKEWTV